MFNIKAVLKGQEEGPNHLADAFKVAREYAPGALSLVQLAIIFGHRAAHEGLMSDEDAVGELNRLGIPVGANDAADERTLLEVVGADYESGYAAAFLFGVRAHIRSTEQGGTFLQPKGYSHAVDPWNKPVVGPEDVAQLLGELN